MHRCPRDPPHTIALTAVFDVETGSILMNLDGLQLGDDTDPVVNQPCEAGLYYADSAPGRTLRLCEVACGGVQVDKGGGAVGRWQAGRRWVGRHQLHTNNRHASAKFGSRNSRLQPSTTPGPLLTTRHHWGWGWGVGGGGWDGLPLPPPQDRGLVPTPPPQDPPPKKKAQLVTIRACRHPNPNIGMMQRSDGSVWTKLIGQFQIRESVFK